MQHQMAEGLKQEDLPAIILESVTRDTQADYCQVGEKAYREHYLHLWPEQDPSPYLRKSFTTGVVLEELGNEDNLLFIIRLEGEAIGIAKLVRGRPLSGTELPKPIYLEKIYLLKEHTGKGYGQQVLKALHDLSREEGGESIYLLTMRRGRALSFYQKLGYRILREEILPFENAIPEERGMYLLARSLV